MYAKHFGWKLIHQHIYSTARALWRLNNVLQPRYVPAIPGTIGAGDSNVAHTVEVKNTVQNCNFKIIIIIAQLMPEAPIPALPHNFRGDCS